jgi:hypothetical protein
MGLKAQIGQPKPERVDDVGPISSEELASAIYPIAGKTPVKPLLKSATIPDPNRQLDTKWRRHARPVKLGRAGLQVSACAPDFVHAAQRGIAEYVDPPLLRSTRAL